MTNLSRDDIVGKTINEVLQSAWHFDEDGYGGCAVYVKLSNNVVFELAYQDDFEELPIPLVSLGFAETLQAAPDVVRRLSVGFEVQEVLTCSCWPTLGLLLSTNHFLYCSDDLMPREVGPCVRSVGEGYELCDIATYWGHDIVQLA